MIIQYASNHLHAISDISNSQDSNFFVILNQESLDGFDYFIVTKLDELDKQPAIKQYLDQHFPLLEQTNRYSIYNLRSPLNP